MTTRAHAPAVLVAAILVLSACAAPARHADPQVSGPAVVMTVPPVPPSTPATVRPTALPLPTASIVAGISAQVRAYLARAGGHAALAVVDRTTGIRVAVNDTQRFKTASIVKVDILATLLYQNQRAHRAMTAHQRDLAEDMITASSNAAADALWDDIGRGPGFTAANRVFGLTRTTAGPGILWGWTETTVGDQLTVLGLLTDATSPLTKASRDYVLGLMSRVHGDQSWGISAAAVADAKVWVKDGWLATTTDDNLWIVNSIGRIVEPGHDFLVVVLSFHRTTQDDGIDVIEHAAKLAVDALRRQP
jgi:hypothetical protein